MPQIITDDPNPQREGIKGSLDGISNAEAAGPWA